MTYDPHPMRGSFGWYAGVDDEHYTEGPYATREECITSARSDGIGEYQDNSGEWRYGIHICEAQENNQDLAEWFCANVFIEDTVAYMDDNGCGSNEDGDFHPLDGLTDAQVKDLEASVRSAIRHWQKRNGLKLRSYWFKDVRNQEYIDEPCEDTE